MSIPEPNATQVQLPNREELIALADAYGVAHEFWQINGICHQVPDTTLAKVLGAMGADVSSRESVRNAEKAYRDRYWRRILPPCTVMREDRLGAIQVHVPHGAHVQVWVELEEDEKAHKPGRHALTPSTHCAPVTIACEQIDDFTQAREIDGELIGQASFQIPRDIPLGYHTLCARVAPADSAHVIADRAHLIVVPARMRDERLEQSRSWGMMAQLYSVRSKESWGLGDLHDLAQMACTFGKDHADFLLINPLHAGEPVGHMQPSPYLPVSRRFFNPIYIRPEDIPEYKNVSEYGKEQIRALAQPLRAMNTSADLLDRDAVWEAKRQALEIIYSSGRTPERVMQFVRFRKREGQGLDNFALWCALQEKNGGLLSAGLAPLGSPDIEQAREELADRIDFWAWLQWVIDEQLTNAQQAALNAGMSYGICHDLAVGVHPQGADVWALAQAFAPGMNVGAPPDFYNQQGQDWSQPPFNPRALEEMGYVPVRDLARTIMRHAGALRLDHVMGLFRLYWIPQGNSADDGTYVYFNYEAMLGIVLLEAQRAHAIVIGEDLGTVDPWIHDELRDRGVLGTSVFWFEKQDGQWPKEPSFYREDVLATVDTHDLPPAAGYWKGSHVQLRHQLGLLTEPAQEVQAQAARERDYVMRRLKEHGLISDTATQEEIIEAIHAYICCTPSRLIGVSLTDAVGEERTQNQPGTDQEYPNWRIPLGDSSGACVLVEDIAENERYVAIVNAVNTRMG